MTTNEDVLNKLEHARYYTSATSVLVPTLDGDKQSYAKWGNRLSTWGRRERRIIANMIHHLNTRGFIVVAVNDGGDDDINITDNNMKDAMEAAFAVDEAAMWFRRSEAGENSSRYAVSLIFANGNDGLDVISDYADAGLFGKAMDDFDAEVFA